MPPPYFFGGKIIVHSFTFSDEIYEYDNVQLLEDTLAEASITSLPDNRILSDYPPPDRAISQCLYDAIAVEATNVLRYFLANGADTRLVGCRPILCIVHEKHVLEVLHILLSFGWDMENSSDPLFGSLGQNVVGRENVLKWCVDHGLDVSKKPEFPEESFPRSDYEQGMSLLERSVCDEGTIACFELLRSLDVPLGGRELHIACAIVCRCLLPKREYQDSENGDLDDRDANSVDSDDDTEEDTEEDANDMDTKDTDVTSNESTDDEDTESEIYEICDKDEDDELAEIKAAEERQGPPHELEEEEEPSIEECLRNAMIMVRYLVDVVGLDVNAKGHGPRHDSTPLGYVMSENTEDRSAFELVAFLLDRGADPELPVTDSEGSWPSIMEAARSRNKTGFLRAVAAWKDKVALEKGETLA